MSLLLSFNSYAASFKTVKPNCESFSNPIGIDSPQPRFSWQMTSNKRSVVQSAYRILVSDNPKDLSRNKGTIWDSEKQKSNQSIQIKYTGKSLESTRMYYWKVMVWDGNDKASAWSETDT